MAEASPAEGLEANSESVVLSAPDFRWYERKGRTRQNTQVNQHSIRLTHLQLLQLSPRQGEGGGGGGIASLLYYFLCTSFCGSNFGQVTARVCFRFTFPFLPGKAPN